MDTCIETAISAARGRGASGSRDPDLVEAARSVLGGVYVGDGWRFGAIGDQGFLRLDFIGEAGWLWFYHAGFEKPDIDHLNLSVRAGPCEPAR